MLNKILSLKGAQKLTRVEQKSINGGLVNTPCKPGTCPPYYFCKNGVCVFNPPPYGEG